MNDFKDLVDRFVASTKRTNNGQKGAGISISNGNNTNHLSLGNKPKKKRTLTPEELEIKRKKKIENDLYEKRVTKELGGEVWD